MWIVSLNSLCNGSPLGIAIDPNTMFTVGILMIGLVMLRLLLRPRRGTAKLQPPARSLRAPSHNLDAPVEVGRWEVHMHETARNLMGELNTKILMLEQLTRDANAAAERLERALEINAQSEVRR